jgi:hypothetical protein
MLRHSRNYVLNLVPWRVEVINAFRKCNFRISLPYASQVGNKHKREKFLYAKFHLSIYLSVYPSMTLHPLWALAASSFS